MQSSLVLDAWTDQMSLKVTSYHVFVLTWSACSLCFPGKSQRHQNWNKTWNKTCIGEIIILKFVLYIPFILPISCPSRIWRRGICRATSKTAARGRTQTTRASSAGSRSSRRLAQTSWERSSRTTSGPTHYNTSWWEWPHCVSHGPSFTKLGPKSKSKKLYSYFT